MRAILILTAIELEARALARALRLDPLPSLSRFAFGAAGLRVAPVGLRAALLDARWPALLDGLDRPLVISAGVCGALDPTLGSGDLVVPESVIDLTGALANVTPSSHRAALAAAPGAATAPLITTRDLVATPEAKADLFARTGAAAVDMESSLLLSQAAAAGLPSLVVRAVSDTARETLPPEVATLLTPEGRVKVASAVKLLAHPRALPRTLTLQRAAARALDRVAGVLATFARGSS